MLTFTLWLQPTWHSHFCINSHDLLQIIIWNLIHLFITNTCIPFSTKWNYFQHCEIIKITHCDIFISINYHPSDLTKIHIKPIVTFHFYSLGHSFVLLFFPTFMSSFSIIHACIHYVTHLHNHSSTLTFSWTNKPKFVSWQ